jgi:hypothetical protein
LLDRFLADFNAGFLVTVSDADRAPGTGNHGTGEYRVYVVRNGESKFDDHMTIRVADRTDPDIVSTSFFRNIIKQFFLDLWLGI